MLGIVSNDGNSSKRHPLSKVRQTQNQRCVNADQGRLLRTGVVEVLCCPRELVSSRKLQEEVLGRED